MDAQTFAFWLQGWFELQEAAGTKEPPAMTAAQVKVVRDHLALVFQHVAGQPAASLGDPRLGEQLEKILRAGPAEIHKPIFTGRGGRGGPAVFCDEEGDK